MGKIELPVDNDTRPKKGCIDEKRKRKRIPMEKKPGTAASRQHQAMQNRRPGGSYNRYGRFKQGRRGTGRQI